MKKLVIILLASGALLTSCWKKTTPVEFVRPVLLSEVKSLMTYDKDFVGVVSAEQYTNYAFRVGGLINKTYVTEGAMVKKGQLMAELDASDFRLQLESDKAQYQTTKSILERNKRLLSKQAISTQDYEIAKSNYEQAKAAYAYTANQLEYTKLRAPFSGSIEKKFVENYQKIQAGEPIYKIINPDVLEVKFTLPESDVNLLDKRAAVRYFIEFDNFRGEIFTAEVKDAVDASVDGAGIPVTLKITDKKFVPSKYNVKAGFACRVRVVIETDAMIRDFYTVPLTAVFSVDNDKTTNYVWVYDAKSGVVHRRKVQNSGLIGGDKVIIGEGLSAGEQVVTAGVYQIVENQKVTPLNKAK